MSQDDILFWGALVFGALLVLGTSLEKYGDPVYDADERKPYTKFRPQLTTSNGKYAWSLSLYVFLMEIIYMGVALVPNREELTNLLGSGSFEGDITWPLFAVSLVVGGQNARYINKLERLFRRVCHKWAKIPAGARETVNVLRRAGFSFELYINNPRRQIGDEFQYVSDEDFIATRGTTEEKWARISSILFAINQARDGNQKQDEFSGDDFDEDLFSEYTEEYEQIKSLHRGLGNAVYRFKIKKQADKERDPEEPEWIRSPTYMEERRILHEDLDTLLELLLTFVACAVRSKQSTESEIRASLQKIGFKPKDIRPVIISPDDLVILFGGILGIVSISVFFPASSSNPP